MFVADTGNRRIVNIEAEREHNERAFQLAAAKLPIQTRFVTRLGEE